MIHSETPPVSLASWPQINRERGVQGKLSQGHGMRSGAQDWNKEGRRWKTLRKETKKSPCSKAAQHFPRAGLSSLCRQESSGLAFGGVGIESNKLSEGWSPLWGCKFLCWVHSEIFLLNIQAMLLRKEGPPSRKILPDGMG